MTFITSKRFSPSGIVPAEIVLESNNYLEPCVGVNPAFAVWAHICGSDIVRDHKGQFFVLEDNLRVPSGVSYMIENREITKRVLPELFENYSILPLDDYPLKLYETLAALSPRARRRPNIVVLTPGIYNSAYFEHAYLAHGMGAELVEGSDLFRWRRRLRVYAFGGRPNPRRRDLSPYQRRLYGS